MDFGNTPELLARYVNGDAQALDQLLERIRPRIVLWAAGRMSGALRQRHDAEDVAQETLAHVHRDIASFGGADLGRFLSWVYAIGLNVIRGLADREGAQKRQLPRPKPFSQTSPSESARRQERRKAVTQALARLSDAEREAIVLRHIEERPVAELAELWGTTPGAVRVRVFRAKQALKRALPPGHASSTEPAASVPSA